MILGSQGGGPQSMVPVGSGSPHPKSPEKFRLRNWLGEFARRSAISWCNLMMNMGKCSKRNFELVGSMGSSFSK